MCLQRTANPITMLLYFLSLETGSYKSVAIALFRKINDIFCMHVLDYDGDDEYESDVEASAAGQGR